MTKKLRDLILYRVEGVYKETCLSVLEDPSNDYNLLENKFDDLSKLIQTFFNYR